MSCLRLIRRRLRGAESPLVAYRGRGGYRLIQRASIYAGKATRRTSEHLSARWRRQNIAGDRVRVDRGPGPSEFNHQNRLGLQYRCPGSEAWPSPRRPASSLPAPMLEKRCHVVYVRSSQQAEMNLRVIQIFAMGEAVWAAADDSAGQPVGSRHAWRCCVQRLLTDFTWPQCKELHQHRETGVSTVPTGKSVGTVPCISCAFDTGCCIQL